MEENKILPDVQSSFSRGCSYPTAYTHIFDDILAASDNHKPLELILLGLSKAVDIINHNLLLAIVHYCVLVFSI